MKNSQECPVCANKKSWALRRNKRKCSVCKYEWRSNVLPLHLSPAEWNENACYGGFSWGKAVLE